MHYGALYDTNRGDLFVPCVRTVSYGEVISSFSGQEHPQIWHKTLVHLLTLQASVWNRYAKSVV